MPDIHGLAWYMEEAARLLPRAAERHINPPMVASPIIEEFSGLASRYSTQPGVVVPDWRSVMRTFDTDIKLPSPTVNTGIKLCQYCAIEGIRSFCEECNPKIKASVWGRDVQEIRPHIRAFQEPNEIISPPEPQVIPPEENNRRMMLEAQEMG